MHAGIAVPVLEHAHAHLVEEAVAGRERHQLLDRHRLRLVLRLVRPEPLGRAGRGFVRHHRVHGVVQVLDEHLPVAVVHVAQHAADDLQLARRASGPPDSRSTTARRRNIRRSRAVVGEAGRTRSRDRRGCADRRQALAPHHTGRSRCWRRRPHRHARSAAVQPVGPGVVGAAEESCRHCRDAVATRLRPCASSGCAAPARSRRVAHHHHRLQADRGGEVVAPAGTWLSWPTKTQVRDQKCSISSANTSGEV